MNVGEAIVTITGDTKPLDQSLKDSQGKVKSSADKMKKALLPVGLALTAVGAAGLKMVDSARKMNAQLGVTAKNLGISTKAMRNLALETTNVTFPLKEVTATFDLLARAGVKDAKVLAATATAFDTLGDATGQSASQVTQMMIPAMKTFGLSAEEMAQKTDMMTFMSRKSTMTMQDFNTMVGYTTPELVAAGLTMEDLTAALIHMEKEGYAPGRVMTREFMKATTLATKEQIPLTEALGMTSEELAGYKEELAGATGMTQEYADLANEQYGIMDKVRQRFDELVLSAGTFLEPLEPLLAGMTALGPLMIALSTSAGTAALQWGLHTIALVAHKIALFASAIAIKAVTAAQWLWNAAMTANPIGLIIVGIGVLTAAVIALWKNWDKATDFFEEAWIKIKIFFLTGVEKVLGSLSKFTGWIPFLGDKIKEAHDHIAGMIDAEKVKLDAIETERAVGKMAERIEERAGELTESIRKEIEERRDAELKAIDEERQATRKQHEDRIDDLRRTYGVLEREDEDYQQTKLDAARKATDEMRRQYDRDIGAARDAYNEKIKLIDAEYAARLKFLDEEAAATIAEYQKRIDAIDARTKEEEKIITEAERAQRILELKGAIESAETDEDYLKATAELADYQARIDRDRLLEAREAEKRALRDRIDEVRIAAAQERDRLREVLEEKKEHERALLDETIARLEDQKIELDRALEEELIRIDNERIAFEKAEEEKLTATLERIDKDETAAKAHYEHQLSETQLHVAAINAATAELKDRTVTITTRYRTVGALAAAYYPPGAELPPGFYKPTPEGGYVPAPLEEAYKPEYMQRGGIAMRPIVASIAEKRPEAVIPLDRATLERLGLGGGGYKSANIYVMLNEGVLAEAVEVRLVDDIYLRTGVRR